MTPSAPVRAVDVGEFIERFIVTPEGQHVGEPLRLMPWQKDFLVAIYDNPAGSTRRAILSVGRKSGKTTLAAALVLNHLIGPSAQPNSNLFSTALSREQAGVLFHIAYKMVRLNQTLAHAITVRESAKELYVGELNTRYRALSSDANVAMGLNPAFCVHDELGMTRGPRSNSMRRWRPRARRKRRRCRSSSQPKRRLMQIC
jgi:phage terminase large subunit-like protein